MRSFVVVAVAVLLFGCPPASDKSAASDSGSSAISGACAKFGDRCEFSPGKYGSCVHRDDCTVEPCLVCQSQH
ncbi:MAG: hypothetical protein ABI421_00120 [Polyangiaceae bacterium]